MITTLLPILTQVSGELNETSTDISSKRIGYANNSIRYVLGKRKWSFSQPGAALSISVGVQEYDLTAKITGYDQTNGVLAVEIGGEEIDPVAFEGRGNVSRQGYYLKPDGKTIGFTKDLDGTESIVIYANILHVDVADTVTTINLPLPENFAQVVAMHVIFKVHKGRRQRLDARNQILDFKESLEDLIVEDASNQLRKAPKVIKTPLQYSKYRRGYDPGSIGNTRTSN